MRVIVTAFISVVLLTATAAGQETQNGDAERAARLWRQFAEQGDPVAQNKLGEFYDSGIGVTRNYVEAMKWYRLAAAQGHAEAQRNVGFMYDNGRGVQQNYADAAKWYRLAAEQGDTEAQHSLGVMYERGVGVPQDFIQAHMWLQLAAAGGDMDAVWDQDKIAERMTSTEVSKAQRMAREWTAKHRK